MVRKIPFKGSFYYQNHESVFKSVSWNILLVYFVSGSWETNCLLAVYYLSTLPYRENEYTGKCGKIKLFGEDVIVCDTDPALKISIPLYGGLTKKMFQNCRNKSFKTKSEQ